MVAAMASVMSMLAMAMADIPIPASFDCAMRKAAYAYGQKLLPRKGSFESLFYALNLNAPNCTVPIPSGKQSEAAREEPWLADAIFVCARAGRDDASGQRHAPLRSIQKALDQAVALEPPRAVVLRGGTHFIAQQILLTARHRNLRVVSFPGERAVVSGGKLLDVDWKPFNVSKGANIWVADITGQVSQVPGLQINGVRATRARFPNLPGGIEVSPGYGAMVASDRADWTPPQFQKYGKVKFYTDNISSHTRNDTAHGWFQHYSAPCPRPPRARTARDVPRCLPAHIRAHRPTATSHLSASLLLVCVQ